MTKPTHSTALDEKISEILDKHAEYYIKQTMKFFQENGESPALSKNNQGDLEAKAAIKNLVLEELERLLSSEYTTWNTKKHIEDRIKELTTKQEQL